MDIEKTIRDLQPLCGKVTPIRTIQETRPPEDFADAYVAEVNVKSASKVIKALDSAFPKDPSLPLPHLRRFAKREILPPQLRSAIEEQSAPLTAPVQTIFVLISPPLPALDKLQALLAPFAPNAAPTTPGQTPEEASPPDSPSPEIYLHPIRIPLYPPFNAKQADAWTKTLWPVVFNPAAPRSTVAPPPQTLNRAQESIEPRAGYYLSLARKVAEEAEQSGLGRGVGAVIVDPAIEELSAASWESGADETADWDEAVLAVAGDARYSRSEAGAPSQAQLHPGVAPNPASATYNADIEGGPELHALMRAADLVARWRRENDNRGDVTASTTDPSNLGHSEDTAKLSPLESYFLYRHRSGTSGTNIDEASFSPSSPKKRKHEQPNPESCSAIDPSNPEQSQLDHPPLPAPPPSTAAVSDPPIPTTTSATSRIRTRSQGGYLCTDLDVYLSHEPCLCCSMGMLLSRFRAVIFPRRGRLESGGLASEPVVAPTTDQIDHEDTGANGHTSAEADTEGQEERGYYGLHWRKELNWRALGFEYVEEGDEEKEDGPERPVFHA
ncbi:uncharacterized protein N7446_009959 [Penicillium canescens]|uniref:tRNA-specific adenosine-34 deaminase subunit Tad3 n=1 Tax=Penicillium canescens TaxID=5083 RepID=A0AAD6I8U6_PENCN|nr:uncharacterized protein N7446_009959 [Penicillium canescens]KAJ6035201.1 hypothetical protein N7460_009376 [Penicillium canescens]KAJ6046858.1 hypothetical protein N7444_008112 [Penicillium canescens]KAJ6053947.1 hypothetical protein N7446_009959 [Penicillium canescens]KAJ6166032.1 hypothetical protein N7485_009276 [Penicillium canescens]